jgi:integrase
MGKLTARTIAALTVKGRYSDGDNLVLQVGPTGNKSWLFTYMRHGRSHQMGLGPVSLISLAEARDKAFTYRRLLLDGIDPLEHRRAALARPDVPTFSAFAMDWIATNEVNWRNEKHKAQWRSSLKHYAEPTIGLLRVDDITTQHVLSVLKPIWTEKRETANRVRNRIAMLLAAAKAAGHRSGDNPAEWRDHLKHLLPKRKKDGKEKRRHHPSLNYVEIPALMAELRTRQSTSARALEFCILTAARTAEVIKATWPEIDLKEKLWTIPQSRTKQGREHRVPLSARAVEILKSAPRNPDNVYDFPSDIRFRRPLSNMAMLEMIRGLRGHGVTVHGTARSGFRTWATEASQSREAAEHALGHKVADDTETSYDHSDMLERRRPMMEAWATFCAAPPKEGRVVAMRRKARK